MRYVLTSENDDAAPFMVLDDDGLTAVRVPRGGELTIEGPEGLVLIPQEDDDRYVQVHLLGSPPGQLWTYIDPTYTGFVDDALADGDLVLVPFGALDFERVGRIVGRGRGSCPPDVPVKRVERWLDPVQL